MSDSISRVTVTVPATQINLTTLLAVKADLSIDNADGSMNVYLARMIASASSAAAAYCGGRVFARQTYEELFRPAQSGELLYLSHRPIASITSIYEDGTLLVAADYEIANADRGAVRRLNGSDEASCWSCVKTKVTYAAGFILPGTPSLASTLPPEIEEAVIRMIKARHLARTRDPYLKSETVDGVASADYWIATGDDAGNMTPDIADLLSPHRNVMI